MGCDIHAYIEYEQFGGWYLFAKLSLDRHAKSFNLMALNQPMFELRGIPDNIGYATKECLRHDNGMYDLHHRGWLYRKELVDIAINVDWNQLSAILLAMESLDVRGDHTRLVFWFDN